ncbi:SCO family protein [Methylacidiphilum caldifontis]|uniref:CRISPR-associated protein Csn1 n=1 Tax=Methylacidiphilum caldifontis TaxID=2795386 RepID=A0A4Y8PGW8_9BACT|nr:SCO family protein [Methylacidiphilum caldifontis]QSR88457.1 SCO family protein [Methylacidiphilum caldifontis]TFE71286.1 CRISPR-associated protein Csn1 [Methylacidiphilum caldifontis]
MSLQHQENPKNLVKTLVVLFISLVAVSFFLNLTSSYFQVKYWKERSNMPKIRQIPPFSLVRSDGVTVTDHDLKGKVWVADLIYTHCPGPCSTESLRMSQLQSILGKIEGVRLVSISIDPEMDNGQILRKYAEGFHADPTFWYFLTGSSQNIKDFVVKGLALGMGENPQDKRQTEGKFYHSTQFVLIDQEGFIRKYYDGLSQKTPKELSIDILLLLQKDSKNNKGT